MKGERFVNQIKQFVNSIRHPEPSIIIEDFYITQREEVLLRHGRGLLIIERRLDNGKIVKLDTSKTNW